MNQPIVRLRPRCAALLFATGLSLPSMAQEPGIQTDNPSRAPVVTSPQPIYTPDVEYPQDGKGAAQVLLEVTVLIDGSIENVLVRNGEEPFASTAVNGIKDWKFTPAKRDNIASLAKILIKIDFGEPKPVIQPLASQDEQGEGTVEIVVLGERSEIGTTFIPIEEARKIPGAFADPLRAAAIQPGVAPALSGLPYFFVRGAPPANVGYLLDGIRIPVLFHVGAGPSIISSSLVERVELSPSAYPAELGRYAGSILSGSTNPAAAAAHGELNVRLFDAGGLVEQPVGDATVLAAGRVSYMQPLLDRVAPDYSVDYWDYQVRANYQLTSRDTVRLFSFGASDTLIDTSQSATLFDAEFHRLELRWTHNGRDGRTQVAASVGQDRILAGLDPNSPDAATQEQPDVLRSRGANIRVHTDQKLMDSVRLRAGIDYRIDEFDNPQDDNDSDLLSQRRRADLTTATYLDVVLSPLSGLELVPGIRLETGLWRDSGYLYPEPRLASRVRLWPGVAWTSSLGIVHQLPTATIRGPGITTSKLSNSVQEAWQAAETLEFALPASMVGHMTAFYSRVRSRTEDSLAATYYGAEFFLRRDLSERIGFVLSYTLSRSNDTEDGITQVSRFDRTHLLSASLGINLWAGVSLGARGYLASGGNYIVQCLDCGPPESPTSLSGRLPAFARVDVRLDKRWDFDSGAWLTLAAEWFNASRSKESYNAMWNEDEDRVDLITQSAITIPSLNLEVGF